MNESTTTAKKGIRDAMTTPQQHALATSRSPEPISMTGGLRLAPVAKRRRAR